MIDLPVYAELTILVGTALGSAVGALKIKGRQGKKQTSAQVPHAKNGFLTLSEIEDHCQNQQTACNRLMKSEFKLMKTEIQIQLDQGDKTFRELRREIRKLNETNGQEKPTRGNRDHQGHDH